MVIWSPFHIPYYHNPILIYHDIIWPLLYYYITIIVYNHYIPHESFLLNPYYITIISWSHFLQPHWMTSKHPLVVHPATACRASLPVAPWRLGSAAPAWRREPLGRWLVFVISGGSVEYQTWVYRFYFRMIMCKYMYIYIYMYTHTPFGCLA